MVKYIETKNKLVVTKGIFNATELFPVQQIIFCYVNFTLIFKKFPFGNPYRKNTMVNDSFMGECGTRNIVSKYLLTKYARISKRIKKYVYIGEPHRHCHDEISSKSTVDGILSHTCYSIECNEGLSTTSVIGRHKRVASV